MFKDTAELAESKLLILYILNSLSMPVSNSHITHIILENNLINYFSLQQYISELVERNFITDTKEDKRHMLNITSEGSEALNLFINRIPEKKKKIIDEYVKRHMLDIKREVEIVSEYEPYTNGKFLVSLKLMNKDETMIELKLPADTNADAKNICKIWKENSSDIYSRIIDMFKNNRE